MDHEHEIENERRIIVGEQKPKAVIRKVGFAKKNYFNEEKGTDLNLEDEYIINILSSFWIMEFFIRWIIVFCVAK